jgi:hypothetical protein
MSQFIIFNQDDGIPAVLMPTQEFVDQHGIQEVALKDVPYNKPFKIVSAADLPNAPQEAWVVPDSALTDGVGLGASRWFIKQYRAEIATVEAEQAPEPQQPMTREQMGSMEGAAELTAEKLDTAYAQYVTSIEQQNADALASWEQSKTLRIAQLNVQIAQMEQEIAEVEA